MNQGTSEVFSSWEKKAEAARNLIRRALPGAKKPAIGFSGGKKSVVLLHMIRQEFTLPLKVIYVRPAEEIKNMGWFTEKLKKLWHLDLTIELARDNEAAADLQLCCRPPIAAALGQLVQTNAIDCLFLGNSAEDPRQIKLQNDCEITYINPIFDLSDKDIHKYIKEYKVPHCSLYDEGYGKLDCRRCTQIPAAKPLDINAVEEETLIKEKLKQLGYL
jgi:phosphoadenosine phosphosulfate reductase